MDFGQLLEWLFTPPQVFGVITVTIVGELYWLCFCARRRVAMKMRAELQAKFLEEFVEPELYKILNRLPEDLSFTLGITPGPATTSYQMFEALGGVGVLQFLPRKVQWWERTLERLARKFNLEMESVRGYSKHEHPIRFAHPPRLKALEAYLEEER